MNASPASVPPPGAEQLALADGLFQSARLDAPLPPTAQLSQPAPPTAPAKESILTPGQTLGGRYAVRRVLGAGAFGEVYEAHDTRLDRRVAIKILKNIDPEVAERFHREVRVVADIGHPNLIRFFDTDFIEHPGLSIKIPYAVMEFLEGHDLAEELAKNGPMSPTRLFPLFVDALRGLGRAHDREVVHKDIKPANLFLVLG